MKRPPAWWEGMETRSLAVAVMVIAAVYVFAATRLGAPREGDPVGPAAFPTLVGIALFASAAIVLYEDWTKAAVRVARARDPQAGRALMVLAGITLWTALYYWAFGRIGYLVATPPYLFVLLMFFDSKKLIANAAIAIIFTLVAYILFSHVLAANLPRGIVPRSWIH